jgi:hypothetical protein
LSFVVRPTAKGFRVIQEQNLPKRMARTVPPLTYKSLGFRPEMTLDEARARAHQLNTQRGLDSKKIAGTARRVELLKTEASAYLPANDVARFESELHDMYADNAYRLEINLRYWKAAQLAILDLTIDPKDFYSANFKLLNYFKARKWSHDYIKRITRVLNLWGTSVCRHRGSNYTPLPKLNTTQVQKINDTHEEAEGVRSPARPLYWSVIDEKHRQFEDENLLRQWNWIKIASAFGLRELEVDNLKRGPKYSYVEFDPRLGVDVLMVYQTKLSAIPKADRWKPIPIYLPQQAAALKLIRTGEFKRPLNKTLQRIFGDGILGNSPRKAFTDEMLERGYDLEDVSIMLGHQKIDITWRVYKNRRRLKLPKSS